LQIGTPSLKKRSPEIEGSTRPVSSSYLPKPSDYVEQTGSDEMVHRDVAGAVHGLVDYLRVERKRVPGEVLVEAERLECLLFLGYDPHFDGDEPPGL
jgi:hypothetical protein